VIVASPVDAEHAFSGASLQVGEQHAMPSQAFEAKVAVGFVVENSLTANTQTFRHKLLLR
jgi:hypothetical protein